MSPIALKAKAHKFTFAHSYRTSQAEPLRQPTFSELLLFENRSCFLIMSFLSVRAVILISNSLYTRSQRLRTISLELLGVYGMISALRQAAVPRRSPSLMSSKLHRLFLCGCTHCPGAETQIGGLAFFFFFFLEGVIVAAS